MRWKDFRCNLLLTRRDMKHVNSLNALLVAGMLFFTMSFWVHVSGSADSEASALSTICRICITAECVNNDFGGHDCNFTPGDSCWDSNDCSRWAPPLDDPVEM